jgi:hypothetical protein
LHLGSPINQGDSMKKLSTLLLNLVITFGATSAMAKISSSAAKRDLQSIEKFQGSEVAKSILLRHCQKLPSISELCKGELSSADLGEVKEAVVADLEQSASEGEPQATSQAVSVNVSSGDNTQQSTSTVGSYPGAACVQNAMASLRNINRNLSGLNARLNNKAK